MTYIFVEAKIGQSAYVIDMQEQWKTSKTMHFGNSLTQHTANILGRTVYCLYIYVRDKLSLKQDTL